MAHCQIFPPAPTLPTTVTLASLGRLVVPKKRLEQVASTMMSAPLLARNIHDEGHLQSARRSLQQGSCSCTHSVSSNANEWDNV